MGKVDPEDITHRILCMYLRKMDLLKDWVPINAWFSEKDQDFLTSKHLSAKHLFYPQASELSVWIGWTAPYLHTLLINIAYSTHNWTYLWHAFPKLQFLFYYQINSISGHLSLLQFTPYLGWQPLWGLFQLDHLVHLTALESRGSQIKQQDTCVCWPAEASKMSR